MIKFLEQLRPASRGKQPIIFWDNVSFDSSKKIFKKFNDERFKYFLANKHVPLYEARNLAIEKTQGDFIAFLDTDDEWLEDKLHKQMKLFTNENIGLVYGLSLIHI